MTGLDTNVLIYFLEKNETFFDAARDVLLPILNGSGRAVVSNLIITELMAGKGPGTDLGFLDHPQIALFPIDNQVARQAGLLRFRYGVKTPDAIHIATAEITGATVFITNDTSLLRLKLASGLKMQPLTS